MIRTRTGLLLALLSLSTACTDAELANLQRGDASAPLDGFTPVDGSTPPGDTAAPSDIPALPDDRPITERPDVVEVRPDVVEVRPDVVEVRPDVVVPADVPPPPRDVPTVCEACTPFAPVAFCRGTGSGACLAYAGCRDGCSICAPAVVAGDTCATAPVISAQGRNRAVFTTCGASDNLNAGCGRNGPDIAVTLRLARTGRVSCRITVPEGVGVVFGYDRLGGRCRDDGLGRACNNTTPQRTQGFDLPLSAGDWTLYIVTTQPSTVVVETDLP